MPRNTLPTPSMSNLPQKQLSCIYYKKGEKFPPKNNLSSTHLSFLLYSLSSFLLALKRLSHQLKSFLPLSRRLFKINRPVRVFSLARNPCRRFCTLLEGLYVARLPRRLAEAENDRIWSMVMVMKGFVLLPLKDVLDNVGRIVGIEENRVLC
jgi:hypothetical protein